MVLIGSSLGWSATVWNLEHWTGVLLEVYAMTCFFHVAKVAVSHGMERV